LQGNLNLKSQFRVVTEAAEHTSVTLIDKKSLFFFLAGVAKCGIRAERTLNDQYGGLLNHKFDCIQSFYYFKVNDTDIQLNAKDILSGFQHFKASIKIER
jgi:hypothetical protein